MFTLTHILWLLIALITIYCLLQFNKKYKWTLMNNLTLLTIVSIASETIKMAINMDPVTNFEGVYLNIESLPFHLCTIQLFFVLYLRFLNKNPKVQNILLSFMFPTMLLGGILAMMIPTEGTSFTNIQTYQYYFYHIAIVYFSIYLVKEKVIHITFKTIKQNYVIALCLVYLNTWINSILQYGGANFMYLSRPPLEGLPLLNLNHGWYVYFITLMMIGIIALFVVQVPFVLLNQKKDKKL